MDSESMVLSLDNGLQIEILKRLSAKELGQIRCVCKALNSIISSSFLITNHSSFNSKRNDADPLPITYFIFDSFSLWTLYSHGHEYTFHSLPFTNTKKLLGVIHGVVCMARDPDWDRPFGSAVLWNPTIRRHFALPDPSPPEKWEVIGFGFDARTNDFKVVRYFDRPTSGHPKPVFEVFSTVRARWTSVASDHILPHCRFFVYSHFNCFLNGKIHWFIRDPALLLVFDCVREEFTTMALPKEAGSQVTWLSIEDGMLLIVALVPYKSWAENVAWVMRDYGVVESWEMLDLWPNRDYVIIEAYSFLFDNPHQFGREGNLPLLDGSQKPENGHVFEPSLFLLDYGNETGIRYDQPYYTD